MLEQLLGVATSSQVLMSYNLFSSVVGILVLSSYKIKQQCFFCVRILTMAIYKKNYTVLLCNKRMHHKATQVLHKTQIQKDDFTRNSLYPIVCCIYCCCIHCLLYIELQRTIIVLNSKELN